MAITRTLRAVSGAALVGALVFASSPTAAADEVRDKQWPLTQLGAETIWDTTKGQGQTVAVIDDGVDPGHADLKGNVLQGKDFLGDGSGEPEPGENHGTAMASLIAGHGHGPGDSNGILGIAPKAKILPLRDNAPTQAGYSKSIRYAVDNGAKVINISQGGNKPESPEEEKAVSYALEHDVLVVAATGNSGSSVSYPAAQKGVLAVGGTQQDGSFWKDSNNGPEVLLTGPASDVITAGAGSKTSYRIGGGTSDAAAYVSGSAALLRAQFPDLSAGQIANRLTETAELPDSEQGIDLPDEKYGYGSVQPLAALTEDIPKGPKYGPLALPQYVKDAQKAEADEEQINAGQEQADQKALILQVTAGVVVLVLVAVIVLVVVLVRRKKRNGPGGPGGWGPPGGQAGGGYGQPPHQQQPGQYAPPQQPPRS